MQVIRPHWPARAFSAALFLAAAAFAFWQSRQLTVLWDLSYILESASRIARGQLPYRDFAIPYAPLTFATQALIIKIFGAAIWCHQLYAAIVGGLSALLAWRFIDASLRSAELPQARLIAAALALPLVALNVGGVFPHPFYDCDATLVMLLCLNWAQRIERKHWPRVEAFCCGLLCVLPAFIKQNVGLIFFAAVAAALLILISIDGVLRRGRLCALAGLAVGLASALAILQASVGLGNYYHYTIALARARRMPGLGAMTDVYRISALPLWLALAAVGFALLRWAPAAWRRVSDIAAALLLATPFLWSVFYLALDSDASERAERLLAIWPYVILLALVAAIVDLTRKHATRALVTLVILCAMHAAFLSQQLWGSTYALWPLLMIVLALALARLHASTPAARGFAAPLLAALIALPLIVSGSSYALSHERLSYVNLEDGEMRVSSLPALAGLRMRGDWLPQFEQLVAYADRNIPREDGVLMLPGEDLFYYTTGRTPRFPALMFDHTVNPYGPQEIQRLARERNIRWVVVKKNLQLGEKPFAEIDETLQLLSADYLLVDELDNYFIYKHR